MSASSAALEPTLNLRFAHPLSPLESALTDTPPVTPLDSALTNTPRGGYPGSFSVPPIRIGLSVLCVSVANRLVFLTFGLFSISFRINTCISVVSKRLYPALESTLMKKPGRGGGVCLTKTKRGCSATSPDKTCPPRSAAAT